MSNYSIFLPSYSVGEECYKEIPYVTRKYGKKAVAIGGKTAMSKAKPELLKALEGTDFEITDFIWYGGDSNYENGYIPRRSSTLNNPDSRRRSSLYPLLFRYLYRSSLYLSE